MVAGAESTHSPGKTQKYFYLLPTTASIIVAIGTEAPSISNKRILESDLTKILDELRPHSDKWLDIGDALGFKTYELANIQATPTLLAGAPYMYLRELLSQWVNWLLVTPEAAGTSPLGACLGGQWKKQDWKPWYTYYHSNS